MVSFDEILYIPNEDIDPERPPTALDYRCTKQVNWSRKEDLQFKCANVKQLELDSLNHFLNHFDNHLKNWVHVLEYWYRSFHIGREGLLCSRGFPSLTFSKDRREVRWPKALFLLRNS